ncbi:MAG TPA: O-antigen ligase, partial [Longimicrobium sp.]|nr:O-antigen ligase [Longimicrobium sp.]
VLVVAQMETILVAMGKDPSLTGRTPIWNSLLESIRERPLLGYGYNGFWLGERGPAEETIRTIGWETPSAHNGFLEVALQLGVVGLAVFLLGYFHVFGRAFAAVRRTRAADGLWPIAILTFTLLYNVTESVLLERNSITWALFVAAVCSPLLRSTKYEVRSTEGTEDEPAPSSGFAPRLARPRGRW